MQAPPESSEFMRTALDKGHDLEAEIERFFASNGYATERNLVLEGRSGGPHEIDVFAKKSDGITEFCTMIYCKAWNNEPPVATKPCRYGHTRAEFALVELSSNSLRRRGIEATRHRKLRGS